MATRPSATAGNTASRPAVTLVSHGFQTNYERGFTNAVASLPLDVTLVGSDRSDAAGLLPTVRMLNLRGSQAEDRPRWAKAANMLRYLCRLAVHVVRSPGSTVHVIGLIEPPLLYGLMLGSWLRLCSRRYVLTVHNLLPHDRHTEAQRRWFRLSFRLPQVLVVHTPVMRDRLTAEFNIPPGRIVHMEHGIEPLPETTPGRDARPDDTGPLRLLFFGVLKHYKGLDLLLSALDGFDRPFTLEIEGICTSDSMVRDIEEQISRHPAREHIQWRRRFVPEAEVPALFARTDALVLPYRAIDQSGVLFQALRFGVPVVAARVGAFDQYVSPEVGELCEPEDVGALRAALRRLDNRRPQLDSDVIRSRGRRYEWPTAVQVLGPVYAN